MQSIPQIDNLRKSINSISLNLHNFQSSLNVINLLNPVPSDIISLLSNPETLDIISRTSDCVDELNNHLTNLNRKVNGYLYKQKKSKQMKQTPYAGFIVDEKPLTLKDITTTPRALNMFNHTELMENYKKEHNKELKPINRTSALPYKGECKFCGAPNEYLYNNNNGDQCKCKVCNQTFCFRTKLYKELDFFCPHCSQKLKLYKDRLNYFVYKCMNDYCSYYKNSLKKQENGDLSIKTHTDINKLRYIYRAFKFTFNDVNNKDALIFNSKISLDRAHHSPQTIGTILTYFINYGLSSRKVSMIMKDIHNISISHQTVMNYAEATASLVQNFTIKYPYELGNVLCGDETYIKVLGKTKYVFFFSDPNSKIITSWKIYDNRDTKSAIESILMSLNKYKSIPEDMTIITDANPIYNAAQVFLDMNNVKFNLQQVIGVSNKDAVSTKYRPYKQIEERLNRTYKQNYYGTNGYNNIVSANVYMILYVTFFNFLRRHSSLEFKPPVELEELKDKVYMFDKWITLINMSASYVN